MSTCRVLILSDTHGCVHPAILELAQDCEYIVHAGDIGAAPVLALLRECGQLIAVRGNNDTPGLWGQDADWLEGIEQDAALSLPGGSLAVIHGHQFVPVAVRHEKLRRHYPEARVVVYGHSHWLAVDQVTEPWIVNPGAAGRSRTHGGPSCLLLDASRTEWRLQSCQFRLDQQSNSAGE